MMKLCAFVIVPFVLMLTLSTAWSQTAGAAENAVVHSESGNTSAL